jgi:hypothetical protein
MTATRDIDPPEAVRKVIEGDGFVVGLSKGIAVDAEPRVSTGSGAYIGLIIVLNRILGSLGAALGIPIWLAIQVNFGATVKLHSDVDNDDESITGVVGEYCDGEMYLEGYGYTDMHNKALGYNALIPHAVLASSGCRVSFSAYTPGWAVRADEGTMDALEKLGFPVEAWRNKMKGAVPHGLGCPRGLTVDEQIQWGLHVEHPIEVEGPVNAELEPDTAMACGHAGDIDLDDVRERQCSRWVRAAAHLMDGQEAWYRQAPREQWPLVSRLHGPFARWLIDEVNESAIPFEDEELKAISSGCRSWGLCHRQAVPPRRRRSSRSTWTRRNSGKPGTRSTRR